MKRFALFIVCFVFSIFSFSEKSEIKDEPIGNKRGKIVTREFNFYQMATKRLVRFYLPPNYDETQDRYPVIYMHDGQQMFYDPMKMMMMNDRWDVDRALDKIYHDTGKGFIVVAIDNGGNMARLWEYTPYQNVAKYAGGQGDKYADFVINTVKPYVDSTYRTLKDRENTAVIGSSLGGLISFYMGIRYHEVFSKVGAFSPIITFSKDIIPYIKGVGKRKVKFYFDGGLKDKYEVVPIVIETIDAMKEVGYSDDDIRQSYSPVGKHLESYWRKDFPDAVKWLFNIRSPAK